MALTTIAAVLSIPLVASAHVEGPPHLPCEISPFDLTSLCYLAEPQTIGTFLWSDHAPKVVDPDIKVGTFLWSD